ncbi:extracellular solute-binding protein [Clostridiales bacterium COT073_COT-073]|nr:extracellular solute-binding protein [Clostridiales bacterium COT073_COT-073]
MKKTLSLVMALLLVVSLAACKPGTNKEADNKGETKNVTLKVWAPQEDQAKREGYDKGLLDHLCQKFNEEHPEWNITFEYGVCGEDVAKDEVTKDLEKAADVFMYANDQIPVLVEAGALAQLGGKNLEAVKAMNSESMMNSVTYKDAVYGVPFSYNGWFMFYDKSKFTEEEVKNLDTMLAKDLGEGVTNVMFQLDNSWYLPAFFYGVGGTMFGPNGTDGSKGSDFNDEKGLAVANYLVDLVNNPKFANQSGAEQGKAISAFAEGKLGAFFTGAWDRENIEKALGANFAAAQCPDFTAGSHKGTMKSFAGSKAIGVNRTSKNMEVAVALAVFLGSQEAQVLRYQARGVVPLNSEGIDDVMLTAITNTVNNGSVAQPLVKEMSNWWSPAETFGKAIVAGEVTKDNAKEKLDTFINNVNSGSGL